MDVASSSPSRSALPVEGVSSVHLRGMLPSSVLVAGEWELPCSALDIVLEARRVKAGGGGVGAEGREGAKEDVRMLMGTTEGHFFVSVWP